MKITLHEPRSQFAYVRKFASFGTTSILAASSQGLGLVQVAALLWLVPAGTETDSYFFLASWSQVPVQILLLGTVYPMWLRGTEHSRSTMIVWLTSVPLASAISTAIATVVFSSVSSSYNGLFFNAVLMGSLGLVSSVCWACVLKLSAEGRPNWFSAITLSANIFSCLALALVRPVDPSWGVTVMISAQICGMSLYLIVIVACNGKVLTSIVHGRSAEDRVQALDSGSSWYFSQAIVGYGAGLVLQTMAAGLPAASLSTVSVIGRVVSGLSSVATNAVLPRLVHKDSHDGRAAYKYVWASTAITTAAVIIIVGTNALVDNIWLPMAAIVASWYVAAALNATVHRVATRFETPRLSAITIAVSVSVPVALLTLSGVGELTLLQILAAYIALDLVSGVGYAFKMKQAILPICVSIVSIAAFVGGASA